MNQNKLSFKSENLWVDSISIRSNVFTDVEEGVSNLSL